MGSASAIKKVREVLTKSPEKLVVVVSAVGGVTDMLVKTAEKAVQGADYTPLLSNVMQVHEQIANELFEPELHELVNKQCNNVWQDLQRILQGVSLTKELSQKSYDSIVGIGERLSSVFLSQYIGSAKLFDSRQFIVTEPNGKGHQVKLNETMQAIAELKFSLGHLNIFPGFIASNTDGDTTTLGRGGSDYSAALLAAGLDAECLEIWTDVDGFMSADPRVIKRAYCIDHLSYNEAMELSHFGAKVIYPPTILPVLQKQIPIKVKNTFNPAAKGTLISHETDNRQDVKGLSSIKEVVLITLQGNGMIGSTGIAMRMFRALAGQAINIILISQASSESSISVVLTAADAELARLVLVKEFEKEMNRREINGVTVERDMAVVAIVGEGMKHAPGVSGKLFSDIGRNGVNIYAIAQGASELNISFVVHERDLRKTLNVVHEAFFLSEYQAIHLYLVGVGTVGKNLLEKIERQSKRLLKTERLSIRLVGLANSKQMIFSERGLELSSAMSALEKASPGSIDQFVEQILANNHSNSVFVDCTASEVVAGKYQQLLENNISVVTANKIAGSSSYASYEQLKITARQKGVKYLFETNVGAGLPIINTINGMIQSGDRILQLEAVLSGTLNYIVNTVNAEKPLSTVVEEAMRLGYSEPDPRIDLKGTDVLRKLLILARESEYPIEEQHVELEPFVPVEYFTDESVDAFINRLKTYDATFEQMRSNAEANGRVLRYTASFREGRAKVGFVEVAANHPFYNLADSNNKVILRSDYYYEHPMEIKGYGAGADVTAAGVFADIIKVANL